MRDSVLTRLLARLPGSLSYRLPLLVVVAYLMGALISGWTVYNLYTRSSALSTAESSGEVLEDVIRQGLQDRLSTSSRLPAGPYLFEYSRNLLAPLPEHSIPLILELGDDRVRAAIAFQRPPKLPNALRASAGEQTAASRLSELSKGIARQDQIASLHVFLPQNAVLSITAPRIWQNRLSQTWVVLIGALAFGLGLSLTLPLAFNLVAPFTRLAARGETATDADVLPSTEAKLIRDKIHRQSERFRAEQERKARGLAAVSHDLRTPVTRLRLRADLLEDDQIRDKFEADLDEVSGIIDNALDLLSLRSQPEESYDFSLVSLLDSLVSDYRDTGKNVEFDASGEVELRSAGSIFTNPEDLTVKAGNACLMHGQPDKLRRAFSNLIDNALKYGGRAIVSVKPYANDMLQVSIRDFGPGIDPDQMERVVLPFVRGHAPQSERGVGLGLSIASELIELHGGTLQFTNTEPGLLVTARVARG